MPRRALKRSDQVFGISNEVLSDSYVDRGELDEELARHEASARDALGSCHAACCKARGVLVGRDLILDVRGGVLLGLLLLPPLEPPIHVVWTQRQQAAACC